MANYAGSISFDTKVDASGAQKGLDGIANAVKGSAVFKAVSAGLDMIKASLDKAFGRLDTIDQFNRVMLTLTGSTDRTNAALATTTDIVTGTAFGLDTAASAVQGFVQRGLTVTQATDAIEAWGDAVAYYGDGSNDTLGRVAEAYNNMLTKGKVSLGDLRSIMQAGIPAIDIYAEAVGKSTSEVSAAISAGSIDAAEFIEVLGEAFETGTEGFPAIAGAAKDAGASWSGTFANMRTAISRGTAAIISAIEDTSAAIGSPSIKSSIAAFGSAFESALKLVAKAIPPVLATLQQLTPILAGVTAAVLVYAAANAVGATGLKTFGDLANFVKLLIQEKSAAIAKNTVIQKLSAVATGISTAANLLFVGGLSAAIPALKAFGAGLYTALGPLGLILLAVVAVTAAIVALVNWFSGASEEQKKYAENLQADADKMISAVDNVENSFRDLAFAYQDSVDAAEKQARSNTLIIDSLDALTSKASLTASEMAELESLAEQLNEEIPELGLVYDDLTQSLNLTTEELRAYNKQQEQTAKDKALIKLWNEQNDAVEQTERTLEDLNAQLEATKKAEEQGLIVKKDSKNIQEDLNDAISRAQVNLIAYKDAATESSEAAQAAIKREAQAETDARLKQKAAIEDLVNTYYLSYQEAEDLLNSYDNNINKAFASEKAALQEQKAAVEDFAKSWGILPSEVSDALARSGAGFADFSSAVDEFKSEVDTAIDGVINGFKLLVEKSDTSTYELFDIWTKNLQRTKEWPAILQEVEDQFGPKGREIAESLGIEYSDTLKETLNNDELGAIFQKNVDETFDVGLETASSKSDDPLWQEAGKVVGQAFGIGITESAPEIETATEEMVESADPTPVVEENHDTYVEAGEQIVEGVVEGIENGAEEIPEIIEGALDEVDLTDAGEQLGKDLEEGVSSGLSDIPTKFKEVISLSAFTVTSNSNLIKSAFTSIFNAVKKSAETWKTSMISIAQQTVSGMAAIIVLNRYSIQSAAAGLTTAFTNGVSGLYAAGYNAGVQATNGMLSGLRNGAQSVYNQAQTIANNVSSTIKNSLQISSPSRVMIRLFEYVDEGMVQGLRNKEDEVYAQAQRIVDELEDILTLDPTWLDTSSFELSSLSRSAPAGIGVGVASSAVPATAHGTIWNDHSVNNFYNPQALSASEQTREMLYQKKQQAWNLP